ncbi:MAG: TRAP transporter permease [Butyricicoccus sp.]|nr:TRAP transporter permease [Butyricicoccus sp.]
MEDVDAIMKKFDRESNIRLYQGVPKQIVRYALVAFSLFVVWMNMFAVWDERIRRTAFLGLVILFVFVVFPRKKGASRVNYIPWYDIILGIAGAASFFYFTFNAEAIIKQGIRISNFQMVLGIVGILVLVEACRRAVGLPILIVASAFVLYAFIGKGMSLQRVIYNLFYTTTGVIGTPIGVCSTYIVLFIIFGAFLEATGIANFFINGANALAGSASGGPAKVAVISSALCGMVSGSSVGNTVTTGSVTIPLMKKTGYKGEFAGAVEAAASTGGQIMPPIMGAAAFLMAEMVGVQYSDIVVRAILPAFLYFAGIFMMVHFEAKKLGLKGLLREELPKGKDLLPQIYLLIPLIALVYMIISGSTMAKAAVIATLLAIAMSIVGNIIAKVKHDETHEMFTVERFFDALENGGRSTLTVAVACGIAGIIAGVVTMTGLGQILISAIVGVANGNLLIALFLTMITCIVLGMGVPTTANYIIMATTCAPILIDGMGLNPMAANMFVFYFGIVADITPPVALAAYAGAAIAKANPMKTGLNASRLAIAAFIIPYIFAFSPAMLFIDTSAFEVVQIVITSSAGMFSIAAALEGYMRAHMSWLERIIGIAAGLLLIYPGLVTDLIGLGAIVAIILFQSVKAKKNAAA